MSGPAAKRPATVNEQVSASPRFSSGSSRFGCRKRLKWRRSDRWGQNEGRVIISYQTFAVPRVRLWSSGCEATATPTVSSHPPIKRGRDLLSCQEDWSHDFDAPVKLYFAPSGSNNFQLCREISQQLQLLFWEEWWHHVRYKKKKTNSIRKQTATVHKHLGTEETSWWSFNPRGPNASAPTHVDVHLCFTVTPRYLRLSEKFKRHLKEKTLRFTANIRILQ